MGMRPTPRKSWPGLRVPPANVVARHQPPPPVLLDPSDRPIYIEDAEVAEPARPRAMSLHLLGQPQHPAAVAPIASGNHPVVHVAGRLRLNGPPRDDRVVEALGPGRVRGHQLIPDEATRRIGHRPYSAAVSRIGRKPPQNMRLPSNGIGVLCSGCSDITLAQPASRVPLSGHWM